ncbi:hypothetical protein CR513_39095, partial [Mucuna pruriens]
MARLVKLSEFSLKFEPRGAIKTQALADFLVEITLPLKEDPWWVLHVDNLSNPKGRGTGVNLKGLVSLEHSLKFDFKASNNQVEYKALLAGLDLARESEVQHIPHIDNSCTDTLARLAMAKVPPRHTVLHTHNTSFEDKDNTTKVQRTTSRYLIEVDLLYKRGGIYRSHSNGYHGGMLTKGWLLLVDDKGGLLTLCSQLLEVSGPRPC